MAIFINRVGHPESLSFYQGCRGLNKLTTFGLLGDDSCHAARKDNSGYDICDFVSHNNRNKVSNIRHSVLFNAASENIEFFTMKL